MTFKSKYDVPVRKPLPGSAKDLRRQPSPPMKLARISSRVRREAREAVQRSHIALVGSPRRAGTGLCGSGTLVRIAGCAYVLTADHVIEQIQKFDSILIGPTQAPPTPRMDAAEVVRHAIRPFQRREAAWGPDLALIPIPEPIARALEGDSRISRVVSAVRRPPLRSLSTGYVILMGSPDETNTLAGDVATIAATALLGLIPKRRSCGGFDYFDIETLYGRGMRTPRSFGGVSGGGLWHVPVVRHRGRHYSAGPPQLIGVAFYQGPVSGNTRIVRAHGITSIYARLLAAVPPR